LAASGDISGTAALDLNGDSIFVAARI